MCVCARAIPLTLLLLCTYFEREKTKNEVYIEAVELKCIAFGPKHTQIESCVRVKHIPSIPRF